MSRTWVWTVTSFTVIASLLVVLTNLSINLVTASHPLHLSLNIAYVLFTFLLHMVYGLILGWLTVRFVKEADNEWCSVLPSALPT